MSFLDKVLRAGDGKRVKALQGLVPDVNALEASYRALSDEALQAKTGEFRQKLANGADLDDILIDAFATMREAATRVIGQRHFDVQLIGGMVLHEGRIAEMKTGEGKTLVATLARAQAEGLLEGGVLPVVKHVPGHGRAGADSHQELPVVTVPLAALHQLCALALFASALWWAYTLNANAARSF